MFSDDGEKTDVQRGFYIQILVTYRETVNLREIPEDSFEWTGLDYLENLLAYQYR